MGVIACGIGRRLECGAMAGCCTPSGYRKIFGERTARRDVRKYRRRGLDRAARQIVGFLAGRGVDGDSVLEVGGGIGAIQLELLKAGAARATNVELSPEYEPYAAELLGDDARVERRVGDFVRDAAELEPADDVVLHRVVCCYPDPEALVGAAAEHARRRLVLSFPPGAVKRPLFPSIVTVTVPSAYGSAMNGPASGEASDFPLSGFDQVRWKSSTVVTSRPLEYTASRNVPCECTTMSNGQVSALAAMTRVRSQGVIVTVGVSATAVEAPPSTSASRPSRMPSFPLIGSSAVGGGLSV